ncbi:MAG: alpha/beta hydrolase [Paludibacter sp.]
MSLQANIITLFLGIINAKKLVEKSFQNPARSKKTLTPKLLKKKFNVSEFQVMNKSVVTVQPFIVKNNSHILFFHGGAYVAEGSAMHWKIIEKIVRAINCKVSYIDYPLAPENNYKHTFEMVQKSFDRLISTFPNDSFMLMGDSAGGGLAMAFAQKLLKENAPVQPLKLILFSPWLDLSMQNPGIKKQEGTDKLLPLSGLIETGRKYSDGDDVSNYLLSPINGDFAGIAKTLVFFGTDELFYPDCKLLAEKVKTFGNFSFREFQEMQHDWVIFPIPEAQQALKIAIEFIQK